ncbi:MAG: DUF6282 family protein [Thermodesulfobacteriota bacterium]
MEERDIGFYHLMERCSFETFSIPNLRGLTGLVDLHTHPGLGRADPLALAKQASRAGMRALVFKMTNAPSMEVAGVVNDTVREWAQREGLEPVTCFGSLVFNTFLGGVNLDLARRSIRAGAKALWMPTLTSAYHLMRTKGISFEEAKRQGVYLLNNGKLKPEAKDVLKLALDKDVILSFGHLSPHEIFALAEEANRIKFAKVMVDHPFASVVGLVPEDFPRLANLGVFINFTYFELSPYGGVNPEEMANWVKEIGPERVLLSSDVGPEVLPNPVESMRLLTAMLQAGGIEQSWIKMMAADNACRLLGLEPGSKTRRKK